MQSIPMQPLKNPGIATVLSFFIPGAGQIYNGQIGKGIVFFGAAIVSYWLCFILIGFVLAPIVWIYAMVDANKTAKRVNEQMVGQLGGGEFRDRLKEGGAT
jgi:TM2 domain-containing membrane protein YozV